MSTRRHVFPLACVGLLLLLVVPAAGAGELAGTWDFVFTNPEGSYPRTLVLTVNGEAVTAKHGEEEEYQGTFKDGVLELTGEHMAPEAGYSSTLELSGKLEQGRLEGQATWDYHTLTFTATKQQKEAE